jgi:hypothetical protein
MLFLNHFTFLIQSATMSKRKRVELSLQDKIKMIKSSETLPKPTIKVRFIEFKFNQSTEGADKQHVFLC